MRSTTRSALAAVPLGLVLLLVGCGGDDSAGPTTTTTTEATTSAPSSEAPTTAPPASSETTAPPTTAAPDTTAPPASGATEPVPTTAPAEDGTEGEYGQSPAAQLVRAWGAGDRERALELATPRAVDRLFGLFDPGGPDWELTGCEGAAGTLYCVFDSASKATTLQVAQPNVPDDSGRPPLIDRVEFHP